MIRDVTLEAWFIHHELVMRRIGTRRAADLVKQLPAPGSSFADAVTAHLFESALSTFLQQGETTSLAEAHLQGTLRPGEVVWLDQAFYFRGLGAAKAGGGTRPCFSSALDIDVNVRIVGSYNAERVRTSTARERLSGRRRNFVLGYIEDVSSAKVTLRPVFIGRRLVGVSGLDMEVGDAAHVWPADIDQFAGVDFDTTVRTSDLNVLRTIPEESVKLWFAEHLGEFDVPKDWGGEQFDLWTTRMTIGGERVRAAIAFKGPAAFHKMTLADLGKNGDQIVRLAQTPADLLVVQHCHYITPAVVATLRALATGFGGVRRYMLIDGCDTIRILQHLGKI